MESLGSLSESQVEERGGIVLLGSVQTRDFSDGIDNNCYQTSWASMAGLPSASAAATLYAAYEARGVYMPGAQFVLSRSALLNTSSTLRRWLSRAARQMQAPGLLDSSTLFYDGRGCCAVNRTCLPWLLERLWLPLFQLNRLSLEPRAFDISKPRPLVQTPRQAGSSIAAVAASSRGGGGMRVDAEASEAISSGVRRDVWEKPHALAALLLSNATSRRELKTRAKLPPTLWFLERQFAALADAATAVEAALPSLSSAQHAEVISLCSPRQFEPPGELELYRSTVAAAGRISAALRGGQRHEGRQEGRREGRADNAWRDERPPQQQEHELEATERQLRSLHAASLAASKWAHALNASSKAKLLVLSNPKVQPAAQQPAALPLSRQHTEGAAGDLAVRHPGQWAAKIRGVLEESLPGISVQESTGR